MKKGKIFLTAMIGLLMILGVTPDKVKAATDIEAVITFNRSEKIILNDLTSLGAMSGTFPVAKIGSESALCMDVGKDAEPGITYVRKERVTNTAYIKAYNYVQKDQSELGRIFAQAYLWASVQGANPTTVTKELITKYFKHKGWTISVQEINEMTQGAMDAVGGSSSSGEFYVWEVKGGNNTYQRFISGPGGKTTGCTTITSANASTCCYDTNASKLPGYKENCGTPSKCPDPTISVGSCGSSTLYSDPYLDEKWTCVAGQDRYKYESNNAYASNNNICTFYCRETVSTFFPGNNYTFEAGQFFNIGSPNMAPTWGPIAMNGTRECRSYYKSGSTYVQGVNYAQANTLYSNANNNVRTAWNAYMARKGMVDAPKRDTGTDGCRDCAREETYYTAKVNVQNGCKRWNSKKTKCLEYNYIQVCPSGWNDNGTNCARTECVEWKYYDIFAFNSLYDGSYHTFCKKSGHDQYDSLNGTDGAYNSAVANRNSVVNAINFCTAGSLNYTLNPTLSANYPGDSEYSYTGTLTSAGGGTASSGVYGNGASKTYGEYNCPANGFYKNCTATTNRTFGNLVNNTSNKAVIQKSVTYNHVTNLQYINKETGKVSSTKPNQYVNLNGTVIPISTTRVPGSYPIGLTYSNVGNIQSGKAHFDEYVQKQTGSKVLNYQCTYNVNNDITGDECDWPDKPAYCNRPGDGDGGTSGIDVIYRPISLSNPFPAESGRGRSTGSNWCSDGDCSSTNAVVQRVITNNRGVKQDAVYQKEPMYTITLTPNIIKQVRKYNRTTNYADFKLTCDNESGERCMSNFIRNTVGGYNFSSLFSGTCSKSNRDAFETCRR